MLINILEELEVDRSRIILIKGRCNDGHHCCHRLEGALGSGGDVERQLGLALEVSNDDFEDEGDGEGEGEGGNEGEEEEGQEGQEKE